MKRGPIIFLLSLGLILIFILGVRYGQKVEKTNKIINYLISLPPTKPPQNPSIEFKTYTNQYCGVEFLYPTNLTKQSESSTSAIFSQNNKAILEIGCDKENKLAKIIEDQTVASAEVKLQSKKLQAKIQDDNLIFKTINLLNGKTVFVMISKSLYPLFEKSLEFVSK